MATLATIRTNVWDAIYTYLQTTNPISTNNIYSAKNSKLVNSVGYPLVIIDPPSVSATKLTVTGAITESMIVVSIEVYHTSSATLKALVDEVMAKLIAGRKTFTVNRLMRMEIDGQDYDYWEESNKTIHFAQFAVNFRYVE